jgi:transcriptional regulator with GAF, ATPase, and Fis domain
MGDRDREQVLAATFVALADTLVDDFDIVDLLEQLVAKCLELLGVTAAGLLLLDQHSHLVVVASSSEEARLLEMFQIQNNEGPCLECVRTGLAVTSVRLEAARDRWPQFVPAATRAGYRSVAAVPMRLRTQIIGALNLFSEGEGAIRDQDQSLARALADVATIGILQQRSVHQGRVLTDQLQHALNSRVVVEQAKGILAERHNLSVTEAYGRLRRHARDHNLKVSELAGRLVQGESLPDG